MVFSMYVKDIKLHNVLINLIQLYHNLREKIQNVNFTFYEQGISFHKNPQNLR